MKRENLVILKGNELIQFQTETLKPNTNYRCIEVSEGNVKQYMVFGIVFDEKTFKKNFQYLHDVVIEELHKIGLIKDSGKPISKTQFKAKASVHTYGRGKKALHVAFFYTHPK